MALAIAGLPAFAAEDGPPPDIAGILQALETLEKQHQQHEGALRQRALQEAQAAASNPQRAAELWEQAERVSKDADQFRTWKEREGSGLNSKEVQNALRLHFNWLVLTLQKSGGTSVRELLPAVIAHTKEVTADQYAMEAFDEQLQRQKELAARSGRQGPREREKRNDEAVKTLHNRVASQTVKGSPVAQMLRLGELVSDAGAPAQQVKTEEGQKQSAKGWELGPFNVEGIYQTIILPELRAQKDPRALEYWDNKMRQLADRATKAKSPLEVDKFNQITRPALQWGRAVEMEGIGLRNRAITEMFSVVKANPAHPNAEAWMRELRNKIQPPPAPAEAASAAATTPATPQ